MQDADCHQIDSHVTYGSRVEQDCSRRRDAILGQVIFGATAALVQRLWHWVLLGWLRVVPRHAIHTRLRFRALLNTVLVVAVVACSDSVPEDVGSLREPVDSNPSLVIRQVYRGGSLPKVYGHDFIELYNRGSAPHP